MRLCAVIAALSVLLVTSVARSGEIEIGGKWYAFEEILPEENVEVQKRKSGLTGYRGVHDTLLDQPVRVLLILGDKWSTCFSDAKYAQLKHLGMSRCARSAHLAKRFWALGEPTLTIRELYPSFYYDMASTLSPPVKKESGWYELELRLSFTEESSKALEVFRILADAADKENNTHYALVCLEVRGSITWHGLYKKSNPAESKYTYSLEADSINVVDTIPNGNGEVPVLSLEDATVRCSPSN